MVDIAPHQQKAVDKLANGKILCGDVGTGKSRTALAYFYTCVCGGVYGDRSAVRRPVDLYVITTAKKRDSMDWEREAAPFGIGKDFDSSIPGISIKVDSWNNIAKYKGVKDAFFIFDEQRVVGSGTWVGAFLAITKNNGWILLSATPGDTWLDYIPVFVANGFYKNRTEFKREHVIYKPYQKFPKVDRYIGVSRLVKNRNKILVEMPFDRHTVRHLEKIQVDYDKQLFDLVVKKRWHVYENRPLRDIAEMFLVMRKVANSDPSRLRSIRTMMDTHPRMIVFYNFDYELEALRTLALSGQMTASSTLEMNQSSSSLESNESKTSQNLDFDTTSKIQTIPSDKRLSEASSTSSRTVESGFKTQSLESSTDPTQTTQKRASSFSNEKQPSQAASSSKTVIGLSHLMNGSGQIQNPSLPTKKGALAADVRLGEVSEPIQEQCEECQNNTSSKHRSSTSTPISSKKLSSKSPMISTRLSQTGSELPTPCLNQSVGPASLKCLSKDVTSQDATDNSQTASFAVAEWNGHKHEPIPNTERWIYLVQYTAGAEGWNCIATDAMVFYSLTYSHRAFWQAQGRIDRMNTTFFNLWYYVLMSDSMIDKAIWKALGEKKDFNEKSMLPHMSK